MEDANQLKWRYRQILEHLNEQTAANGPQSS